MRWVVNCAFGRSNHWPPPRVALRVIGLAALIWAACRATGWAVTVTAPPPFGPPLVALLVVALVQFQLRRSNEMLFLQNLAVRPAYVSLAAFLGAALLEVALWSTLVETGFWTWTASTP